MFNPNFNTTFQSMGNAPAMSNNQTEGFGPYTSELNYAPPHIGGDAMGWGDTSQPMSGDLTEGQLYPLEDQQTGYAGLTGMGSYASGGRVKRQTRKMPGMSDLMKEADKLRQKGQRQDTILAHINPQEAQLLSENFGHDINPHTGLPQFGLFNNPLKWLKGSLGGGAGAVLGNMMLPGLGGIIGGALGGAAGSAIRGRKDYMQAGLRGAGMGAALPTVAGLGGSLANGMGYNNLGATLTNYGNTNAILPALGLGGLGGGGGGGLMSSILGTSASPAAGVAGAVPGVAGAAAPAAQGSLLSQFLEPKNLLAAASVAGNFMNRPKTPKQKTGAELGAEQKAYELAQILTSEERARKQENDLAAERSKRYVSRNRYLPDEAYGNIAMTKSRDTSPEERRRTGRNIEYIYENEPVLAKTGGKIGTYIKGKTKGQDDKINAQLSDGEFVIPADVVSHLGDGNNEAGASQLHKLMNNVRKDKTGNTKLPTKAKSILSYMG